MVVVLNSDILYHGSLLKDHLSAPLGRLIDACRTMGHRIIVPLTAKLEFDRQQGAFRDKAIAELRQAQALLERYGITVEPGDDRELVTQPDLSGLVRDAGAEIEIAEPSLEDFRDAHRRACLHERPHSPDKKSDEMRDLIIWVMAVRLAKEHGGALLVSRDVVHTHERGNEEAEIAGLMRVASTDEALVHLQVSTPAARTILALLSPAWQELREMVPLADEPGLLGLRHPVFIRGNTGLSSVSGEIDLPSDENKTITAEVDISMREDGVHEIRLANPGIEGKEIADSITLSVKTPDVDPFGPIYDEAMKDLNEALGEE